MLARHSSVYTIPESHFFLKIRGRLGASSPWPIVSPRAARRALEGLVDVSGQTAGTARVPHWWLGRGRYSSAFQQVMDDAAASAGATVWVEKSPVHLHYMEEIERRIADVSFLHLLKDGRDVVASLVHLCESDPESWVPQLLGRDSLRPGRQRLIDAAVARWNRDLALSLRRGTENGHFLVFYGDLIDDLRQTLETICHFLAIPYESSMERHWEGADRVVGHRVGLPHMETVLQPVTDRRLGRFHELFDDAERRRVVDGLMHGGDPKAALADLAGQRGG